MTALWQPSAFGNPTPAQWNTLVPKSAIRTSDSSAVNNSTTLINDALLFIPNLDINVMYAMDLLLLYDAAAAADFKFGFTAPAGSSMTWGAWAPDGAIASFVGSEQFGVNSLAGVQGAGAIGVGSTLVVHAYGSLTTAGATGTLQLQWAQLTANVSNAVVRAGSFLKLQQIA